MEIEAKLLIVSRNAAKLADEIAGLRRLGRYLLIPRAVEGLRDTYWDVADGQLGEQRVALRLRQIDGRTLITLKGPSGEVAGGVAARMELEEPWSAAAYATIRRCLADYGLWPSAASSAPPSGDPFVALRAAGLVIVQDRETDRRPRDLVVAMDTSDRPAAELAIDLTTFHVGADRVLSREIEIESKVPDGGEAVQQAAGALLELYPGQLKRSKYAKISLGKAIAALSGVLHARGMLAPDGGMLPDAYSLVEEFLATAHI